MPLRKPTIREAVLLACLLVLLLGQAALTFSAPGQTDEVSYVNPGASWSIGDGFVSNLWFAQTPGQAWATSTPGMPLLYAAWFKLVGFGSMQSRMASLALHLAGIALLTRWASRRFALSAASSLGFASLLLLLPSVVLAGVSCRLEVFALIFFTIFAETYFPPGPGSGPGWPRILTSAALLAFIGMHFVGYYALACAAVFLAKPSWVRFRKGAAYAAGMALGLAALWVFFASQGTWEKFVASRTRYMSAEKTAGLDFLLHGWRLYAPTPDVVVLGVACLVVLLASRLARDMVGPRLRSAALAGLIVYLSVPTWINAVGIYYVNYAWMVTVPLLCLAAPWLARLVDHMRLRHLVTLAELAIGAYGAATGYLVLKNVRLGRQYDQAASQVITKASPSQALVISPHGFYQMRPRFPLLYLCATPRGLEARRPVPISWIVEQRPAAVEIARKEGGEWEEISSHPFQPGTPDAQDVIVLRRR